MTDAGPIERAREAVDWSDDDFDGLLDAIERETHALADEYDVEMDDDGVEAVQRSICETIARVASHGSDPYLGRLESELDAGGMDAWTNIMVAVGSVVDESAGARRLYEAVVRAQRGDG